MNTTKQLLDILFDPKTQPIDVPEFTADDKRTITLIGIGAALLAAGFLTLLKE